MPERRCATCKHLGHDTFEVNAMRLYGPPKFKEKPRCHWQPAIPFWASLELGENNRQMRPDHVRIVDPERDGYDCQTWEPKI